MADALQLFGGNVRLALLCAFVAVAVLIALLGLLISSLRTTVGLFKLVRDAQRSGQLRPLNVDELTPCPLCVTNGEPTAKIVGGRLVKCSTCRGRCYLLISRK